MSHVISPCPMSSPMEIVLCFCNSSRQEAVSITMVFFNFMCIHWLLIKYSHHKNFRIFKFLYFLLLSSYVFVFLYQKINSSEGQMDVEQFMMSWTYDVVFGITQKNCFTLCHQNWSNVQQIKEFFWTCFETWRVISSRTLLFLITLSIKRDWVQRKK